MVAEALFPNSALGTLGRRPEKLITELRHYGEGASPLNTGDRLFQEVETGPKKACHEKE